MQATRSVSLQGRAGFVAHPLRAQAKASARSVSCRSGGLQFSPAFLEALNSATKRQEQQVGLGSGGDGVGSLVRGAWKWWWQWGAAWACDLDPRNAEPEHMPAAASALFCGWHACTGSQASSGGCRQLRHGMWPVDGVLGQGVPAPACSHP